MSTAFVEVSNLTRTFGDVKAVDGLSFNLQRGQVVGFIGANGAGKTTTMRMMAGLELPDKGTVSIGGRDVLFHGGEVRRIIGWMPDTYGTYEHVTVFEYLDFFARTYGFIGAEREQRVQSVMEFTDLLPLADKETPVLSKGMKQRLCLGRALIPDPQLLILDEPAAGLDPKARIEVKHLVRLLGEHGKTLFISSHILSELEDMCDTLLFIDRGRMVHHGSADHLKRGGSTGIELLLRADGEAGRLEEWLTMQPGVKVIEQIPHGFRVRLDDENPVQRAALLRRMVEAGLPIYEFREHQRRLEDAFVDLVEGLNSKGGKPQEEQ